MRRIRLHVVTVLGAMLLASPALAQRTDHLACFKARDNAPRTRYSLTLTNDAGALGCKVKVPAKLVCLESAKSNTSPTPPGGGPTTPVNSFLCYQMKCPRISVATTEMTDQFGRRTVSFKGAQLLCAPADRGPVTRGPAGPGASTTSTTLATGQCRFTDGRCVGQCAGNARCGTVTSSTSCECRSTSCGDASAPECSGFCPTQGEACIFSVTGCSCARVP